MPILELELKQESEIADQQGRLSAGQQLKKARLSQGWDVAHVADRLKMPESYIHFMEKDEYSRLPNATFARGYLHAYARCMDLPIDSVSNAYNQQTATQGTEKNVRRFFSCNKGVKNSDPMVLWISFGIFILCLALSVFWWQDQYENQDVSAVATDQVAIKTADGQEIIENLAALPPQSSMASNSPDIKQAIHETADVPAIHAPVGSLQENILEVLFSDSSWIEIKDSKGHMLFTGIKNMGEQLFLKNISFFDIVIGNAAAVKLSYNSAPVDLGAYVDTRNVATLTLGF